MSHHEELAKLRKRMLDAITLGVVDLRGRDFYEATLIQIMNEAERQRQFCVKQAEDFRRQAAIADGQASAYNATISVVFNVLNGLVTQAERSLEQEKMREAEEKEKAEYAAKIAKEEEDRKKEIEELKKLKELDELNKKNDAEQLQEDANKTYRKRKTSK
jgi:hypothetical protein